MKALMLTEYNKFSVEEVDMPTYGADDVLIRVKACAICGSDVHGIDGSTGRRIPPIIMGHEASGIIEKTGENVKAYKPGDRVTFDSTVYCGKCYFCKRGEFNRVITAWFWGFLRGLSPSWRLCRVCFSSSTYFVSFAR